MGALGARWRRATVIRKQPSKMELTDGLLSKSRSGGQMWMSSELLKRSGQNVKGRMQLERSWVLVWPTG